MLAAKVIFNMVQFGGILQKIAGGVSEARDDFIQKIKNAKVAGKLLANALLSRYPFACQSFSIVAFSLGTQVIFSCIKELRRHKAYGILHNIYLLGGAFSLGGPLEQKFWRDQLHGTVTGKVHNAFCTTDRILQIYEMTVPGTQAIGLKGIAFDGGTPDGGVQSFTVENTNVTSIANGHLQYRDKI